MRSYLHRWAEAAGAQLLVVDPDQERQDLSDAMAGRGVHVTWVHSTTDALVAFGRTDPHAVVVAPTAHGIPAEEFVTTIRRHGSPYVIAAVDGVAGESAGSLLVAGASTWVSRPYRAGDLWELLVATPGALEEHAHVTVGPLELDAAAYRVSVAGERQPDLPLKEFELLRALMLRAPEVVSDDELRVALWGPSEESRVSGSTIAMHVTRLRARLEGAAEIRRVRGRGYSLTTEG
ncbi:response regulator transcription factor [Nocardioides sp. GY 10113]|uniref:winged helix-turn-helix transcriptional regulator n=1 Tax=Nocardioides sp. GY 10113 TaxID=2569761 RepID=UPI0010A93B85|nr:winged helix-turn-helix domain-containing protein [Nocardioides sp. GY 10113]TIC88360.1 response regulator transcription factor [Nocardioides sp. GY 10113]